MLTKFDLEKFDPSGMHKIYDQWPKLAKDAYSSDLDVTSFSDIDHIVIAGMGGSGAIGNLFYSIFSKNDIHITLVKGYLLPKTVNSKTLVITISISGNTVETLNVLKTARELHCNLIAFSSGGKMQEFCKKHNLEFHMIKKMHSPRSSFVTYVYSLLKILKPFLPITENDIDESISVLENTQKLINSENLTETNPSLLLSQWITNIPLIYYPHGLQAAAIRFKSSLQENAKSHVIIEDVIESCHNGIVAWEKSSSLRPILIQGNNDYSKTKERWQILKKYFNENKIEYFEVFSVNGNILSKLMDLIYRLDYATIYKAIYSGIDPSTIKSIDFVKNHLDSNLE
ncbi:SIS domain-containing protein [Nitrosopumilus piranensis]|uniref:Putative bifunctional phosphoglucose/phosphomannose isomerase n=1 Tax=Nitrosopumilus piranensis TaxID=1582439 RepID=A0A0C5BWE2_9ARCH|nr:SIS domain-containing protein [Nitrosopumilus piranensis]AJM91300.1 putative bifunctional phosphoglucose/phosphomannose isomerase [Nitrosopumilus piranensis]